MPADHLPSHRNRSSDESPLSWLQALVRRARRRHAKRSTTLRATEERWAHRALTFDTIHEILNLTLRTAITIYLIKLMFDGTAVTTLLTAVTGVLH